MISRETIRHTSSTESKFESFHFFEKCWVGLRFFVAYLQPKDFYSIYFTKRLTHYRQWLFSVAEGFKFDLVKVKYHQMYLSLHCDCKSIINRITEALKKCAKSNKSGSCKLSEMPLFNKTVSEKLTTFPWDTSEGNFPVQRRFVQFLAHSHLLNRRNRQYATAETYREQRKNFFSQSLIQRSKVKCYFEIKIHLTKSNCFYWRSCIGYLCKLAVVRERALTSTAALHKSMLEKCLSMNRGINIPKQHVLKNAIWFVVLS